MNDLSKVTGLENAELLALTSIIREHVIKIKNMVDENQAVGNLEVAVENFNDFLKEQTKEALDIANKIR